MKNRIVGMLIGIILLISVTGCVKGNVKTVTCVSGKVGKKPEVVYHEIYTIENNEIVKVEKYNIRTFDNEYLKLVSLDDVMEVYKKEKDTKVEKIGDNQLKVIDTNPTNVFKDSKSDDIAKFIIDSMQKKDFSPYNYTCTSE
ncbi:MAG: hypothetical protein Q4F33_05505 [Mycoplasmatota bacterium]|nr:hypothetical protein [Mycoplasmatota bacterium]